LKQCKKPQQRAIVALLAIFCSAIMTFLPHHLFAQGRTITGVNRDGSTNLPVPFANVSLKGLAARTDADNEGKYALEIPASYNGETITLIVRAVSYKTEQRTIPLVKNSANSAKPLYVALTLLPLKYLLQEVSVYSRDASRTTPDVEKSGMLSLSAETVQKNGGFLKDALRAVQTMPGAIGTNELSARVGVRGGSQDENLVLINGTQVFEPYHIKYAASASIGVFNTDLI
jgi:hypothetical protein